MGADLYIDRIVEPARELHEKAFHAAAAAARALPPGSPERTAAGEEVDRLYKLMYPKEGYFRAAYNGASFMSRIDLSWWRDVSEWTDEEDCLDEKGIRRFLHELSIHEIKPATKEELQADNCTVDDGANSPNEWMAAWVKHRDDLVAFLEGAIANGDKIRCSL